MSPWTRLGYGFAFALVLSALTFFVLLIISWDVASAYMESDYPLGVPAIALVVGYLIAPMVQPHLRSLKGGNAQQPRKFFSRIAYSLMLTLIVSVLVLAVLAFMSRDAAYTFLHDNYYAGVFVIAFLVVPILDRFRASRRRGGSERAS
jgi:hypothetical protein